LGKEDKDHGLKIGVIGTGVLGTQISAYLLSKGAHVVLKTRFPEKIEVARIRVNEYMRKRHAECDIGTTSCLDVTASFQDLSDCELAIEASKEDIDVKRAIFRSLSEVMAEDALIMSNTSSISIDRIAGGAHNPARCVGFHLFNPVDRMELAEIVIGPRSSTSAVEKSIDFARSIGKHPIQVKDSPGFIVNRLLLLQLNEAARMLEEGISSIEAIDTAIKLGLKHPMGPFELADLIGLDVCTDILHVMYESTRDERYRPSTIMLEMVSQKRLGRKSGRGFYSYE
jgi:3-hydroxybutyryl-CoA dehydrogenase